MFIRMWLINLGSKLIIIEGKKKTKQIKIKFLFFRVYSDLNKKQNDYVKELEEQKEQLLEALHEEKEKSRIDYNKLEELSEQVKKHKIFEKEISLSGYLNKFDKEKQEKNLRNDLVINSYLSQYLK